MTTYSAKSDDAPFNPVIPKGVVKPARAAPFVKMVPFDDVQPLMNILRNATGDSEGNIMERIGYSDSMVFKGRREGQVRLSIKYALQGLIAQIGPTKAPIEPARFSDDELADLFAALIALRKAAPGNVSVKPLIAKIAAELAAAATR